MKKFDKKRIAAGMMAAVCVSALLAGCGSNAEDEAQSLLVPVTVQKPEAGTLSLKNEFIGTVSPQEAVYVVPMVTAEVLVTNVSVGETVAAGDILCQLDSEAAQLQMESAQAQYSSAQAGVASAQAGLGTAQAGLNSAQVGYNGALASYASAEAQADAQLGGQKKLQDYQTQVGIDKIKDNLADMEDTLDEVRDQRDTAKKRYEEAEADLEKAAGALEAATAEVAAAEKKLASLKAAGVSGLAQRSADVSGNDADIATFAEDADDAELKAAEDARNSALEKLNTAKKKYEAEYGNYLQQKATYEALKQQKDTVQDAYNDLEDSLEQAETIKKITDEDVYGDVQRIVDTTKGAAMSGVNSAEAGIASAQAGIASAQAGVASAKVGVEMAQVGIDSAQYQLDMYTITAPIDGVIEAVSVEEHGFASPGNPAFVISNKSTMTVTFYASAGIRNTFQIGQKVQVERDGTVYDASITEIGSMVDQTTGLFKIKASVTAPDSSLLTGTNVKVIADTYEQSNTLMIPYDAVYYADEQAYVYVAENGKAVRRNIETGIFDETTITVLSGLTADDQVIVSWSSNLRDGADISVQPNAANAASTEGAE